jgi:hypothetical protein
MAFLFMKKSTVLFSLFFAPSFVFLLLSCDPPLSCVCPPIQGAYFRTTDLAFQVYDLAYSNSIPAADSASINQSQLVMQLEFDVDYYSAQTPAFNLMDFTNSAYACSCVGNGDNGSEERIRMLEIITLNDLDSNHLAGSSINDLLSISQYGSPTTFTDLAQTRLYYPVFELAFTQPVAPNTVQLQANVEMLDGTIYASKTIVVDLQ